mgnify:FL=1
MKKPISAKNRQLILCAILEAETKRKNRFTGLKGERNEKQKG